uniref:2b protein n=1 Tax=Tobacco rattle virus TaxID=12295 RepID=A0A1D8QM80_9VIRU|nr:2b protein [Tobacco rattle virus]
MTTDWVTLWPNDQLFLSDTYQLVWFDETSDKVEHKHFSYQTSSNLLTIPRSYLSFVDNRLPMCINHKGNVYIKVGTGGDAYYQKFGDLDVSNFNDDFLAQDAHFVFNNVVIGDDNDAGKTEELLSLKRKVEVLQSEILSSREHSDSVISKLKSDLAQAKTNYFVKVEPGLVLGYGKAGGELARTVVAIVSTKLVVLGERYIRDSRAWKQLGVLHNIKSGSKYVAYDFVEENGIMYTTYSIGRLKDLSVEELFSSVVF